jgi:hypothetical protein
VELVEHQHLRATLHGRPGRPADDLVGLLDADRRPRPFDDVEVGVGLGQRQRGVTDGLVAGVATSEQGRRERPGQGPLPAAPGPDEEVGVHR